MTFGAPGTGAALASGQTLTTEAQAQAVGAADLTSAPLPDGGDRVRYGTVLFNTGRSDAYDATFTDTIPTAYLRSYADANALAAGVNLIVQRGGGGVLTLRDRLPADLGSTAPRPSPSSWWTTTPRTVGTGGLNQGRNNNGDIKSDGSNAVVVSYDLTLDNATAPVNSTIPNTVTLTKYAGENNGADHTATDLTDSAQVKTPPPAFAKALTGTEVTATGNGQFQAVIGEKVTYMLTVTVPEGLTPAAQIVRHSGPGLAFVQLVSTTPSVGVTRGQQPANASPSWIQAVARSGPLHVRQHPE